MDRYRKSRVVDFCDSCGNKKAVTLYYRTDQDNETCCDDCVERRRQQKKAQDTKTMIVNSMSHGEIVVSRETGEWL
jgi:hypothetical protein